MLSSVLTDCLISTMLSQALDMPRKQQIQANTKQNILMQAESFDNHSKTTYKYKHAVDKLTGVADVFLQKVNV